MIHGQKQYTPKHCENVFEKDDSKTLYINLDRALQAWLPDGYSRIFRSFVFGPSGLTDYGSATLRCKI